MFAQTMFVTGGSRGIGEAVVRAAAQRCNVAFAYNKNALKAQILSDELTARGSSVFAVPCDVSDPAQVKAAVDAVVKRFGKIDVLVNNAGIAESGLFQEISDETWRKIFAVDADGVFYVTRAVLPGMIACKNGAVINVSSIWGQTGASMETAYSAAKAAVIGMTKALAKEVAPSGITVNAVSPGAIDTDMMKCYRTEDIENLKNEIPLGRLGLAEEVAEAVMYLAGARYVTGQVLSVSGGLVI